MTHFCPRAEVLSFRSRSSSSLSPKRRRFPGRIGQAGPLPPPPYFCSREWMCTRHSGAAKEWPKRTPIPDPFCPLLPLGFLPPQHLCPCWQTRVAHQNSIGERLRSRGSQVRGIQFCAGVCLPPLLPRSSRKALPPAQERVKIYCEPRGLVRM